MPDTSVGPVASAPRVLLGLCINVTAIEPGGMQTGWAGSYMTVRPISAHYRSRSWTLLASP